MTIEFVKTKDAVCQLAWRKSKALRSAVLVLATRWRRSTSQLSRGELGVGVLWRGWG